MQPPDVTAASRGAAQPKWRLQQIRSPSVSERSQTWPGFDSKHTAKLMLRTRTVSTIFERVEPLFTYGTRRFTVAAEEEEEGDFWGLTDVGFVPLSASEAVPRSQKPPPTTAPLFAPSAGFTSTLCWIFTKQAARRGPCFPYMMWCVCVLPDVVVGSINAGPAEVCQ